MSGTRRAGRWLAAALVASVAAAAGAEPQTGAGTPAAAVADPGPAAEQALGEALPPEAAPEAPPAWRPSAGHARLEAVWRETPGDLLERTRATRAAALQLGIWSFDPGARAILHDPSLGSTAERAEAAALLAPELPDAWFALARVRLADFDLGGGFDALLGALGGLRRHPDARGWFEVTLLDVAAKSALFGGLLFVFVAGLGCVGKLAVPLSLRLGLPASSAAAALGALLLLPAALGEGLVGVAFACAALALATGSGANRIAVLVALLLVLAGLQPLAGARDRALGLLSADPLGAAASSAERDFASPLDLVRLERAAADDALAQRALALQRRRDGDVAASDRLFRELIERGELSAAVLNNAANTRFAAGAPREALALYERAAEADPTPLGLFNLAQAYGRAILLEEQELALSQAQALDARAVHELTLHVAEVGVSSPVDLAISAQELRARAELVAPPRGTDARRRALAPGRLGRSAAAGFAGLVTAIALAAALALPLRWLGADDDLYAGLARMLRAGHATDPALRMAHLTALRAREAHLARLRRLAAWTVPGAAGLQAGNGLLGLGAALLAAFAVTAFAARGGLLPDALSAAATGAFVLGAAAAGGALGYLTLFAAGLARSVRRG